MIGRLEAETDTGGIFIDNTGDLSVGGVTPDPDCIPGGLGGVDVTGLSGDIVINNDGSVRIHVDGDNVTSASGNITITATGADSDIVTGGNQVAIDVSNGTGTSITLTAGGNIVAGGGTFGHIEGGTISLDAGNHIGVQGSEVNARDTGTVTATADELIFLLGAGARISTEGGTINLTADADGDLSGDFSSHATSAGVDSTQNGAAGGNITISAAGMSIGAPITAGTADVTLTATTGTITDTTLSASRVQGDQLTASAVSGILLQTNVNEMVSVTTSGAGAIDLRELDGVTLTSVVAQSGPVTITTGGTTAAVSVLSTTNSDANDVSITASAGNITVTTVAAGTGISGDVTIEATTGNVVDDLVNTTRITGDVVTLTGRDLGQTGANDQLDTAAVSLVASSTSAVGGGSHGMWITDVDALTITSATSTDGVIVIDAGTSMNAVLVTAGGASRNVRLRALGGSMAVGSISATGDVVFLSSTANITDGDAGNDVTALGLMLQANGDIGSAADPLETTVTNVAWATGTGSIDLVNTGALTINVVTAFGSTITGGTGGGHATITALSPLTVAANVTMAGDVLFTAGEIADDPIFADDLTVNSGVTVQSTTGNVTLRAGDSVHLPVGSTVNAALDLEIAAGYGDLDQGGTIVFDGTFVVGRDLTLYSYDPLVISRPLNVGANTIRLQSVGNISQTAPGIMTAGSLARAARRAPLTSTT